MKYGKYGDIAYETVVKTMYEGEKKYPTGAGVRRSTTHQCRHAIVHLVKWLIWRNVEDLEHALTRVAIILNKVE